MSQTAQSEFKMPDLRIVLSAALVPHEREDESRAVRLSERLRRSGFLKNPPIVTEALSADGGPCFVVLDGANRVSAARATKLPHVLVQVVRYDDPGIELTTWHHALSGFPAERLERELASVPGLTLGQEGLSHARALLARREAIAYVVSDRERALTLHGDRGLYERNALLNAVVDLYRDRAPFHRVMRDSLSGARARFSDITALVVFPRFHPDEILEIATSGARLPAGITRHVIPWRALRVNAPLDILADPDRSIGDKNAWLTAWIAERVAQKNVRFYEESTVLFDE
jgi:L-serine kinase (ATP) / ParB family transcriptional regulator, heme-responsive regulator